MINNLLFISLAPVFIIAFYIYNRDKYEKEPFPVLLKALFIGVLLALPVVLIERILMFPFEKMEGFRATAYTAFVVAGLTEEGMKFLAFIVFIWRNRNFNEKFDGIVYAVFISLGFAGIENILYVFTGGVGVGLIRALTAVPAHALFGVMMGYYFGKAKFSAENSKIYLILAFLFPFFFHGLYDFLLMSKSPLFLTIFVPVFIFFWFNGFNKMAKLSAESQVMEASGQEDNSGVAL